MRGWDTYLAAFIIAILCLIAFHFNPNELWISRAALEQGEWFRCLSFMFAHNNASHLLTNLVALAFVTLLAQRVKISGLAFLAVFIGVGFIAITPTLLVFSSFRCLGASAGISALFGFTTMKIRQYGLPVPIIFLMFALTLGLSSAIDAWLAGSVESVVQFFVHMTALIIGAEMALIHGGRTYFFVSRS
jgi:membrane associated rhomboid family serine protease